VGELSSRTTSADKPPADRLDSWKEIAAYLNRDVTTVQRWAKREGMPVHRHLHDKMGSVYASRVELDAWARGRNLRSVQQNGSNASAANSPALRRPYLVGLIALAVVIAVVVVELIWGGNYRWRAGVGRKTIQSLAVLPLENLSGDPDQEYLSDGMTDALITQLSKTGALLILPKHNVIGDVTEMSPRRLSFLFSAELNTWK
jgi:hypothetical protein